MALSPLLALTPKYEGNSHKVYVDAIDGGLNGPGSGDIKNIALTGGYGVGKSSVLQKVAENHKDKVVQVSLSTLGFEGAPGEPGGDSKTNQIQKEIVKQLLYQEEPVKMPGSRFRRIGRFKKLRAISASALLAVVLVLSRAESLMLRRSPADLRIVGVGSRRWREDECGQESAEESDRGTDDRRGVKSGDERFVGCRGNR